MGASIGEIAMQTARVTDDVASRVGTIRADTASAVQAIAAITATISRVDDYQAAIASAVDEQTDTTNEMSRNVSAAAGGSTDIADALRGVMATMDTPVRRSTCRSRRTRTWARRPRG
jgi:methyl-accepting chemotaxis protein